MTMTTIAKRFTFDAAHSLPAMPEGHKCRRMHGHTYTVELQLRGKPDPHTGLFLDYEEIARAWEPLQARLDHQTLNEVEGLGCPTTEVLARWIFRELLATHLGRSTIAGYLNAVVVHESSTTWARVERADLRGEGVPQIP